MKLSRISSGRRGLNDRYLIFLMCVLAGYAMFGRGFAYVGYPPLFIGEFSLLIGVIALAWSGALVATVSSIVSLLYLTLLAWVIARTIPFLGKYGLDGLRDSVIVVYGIFGLVIAGLLVEKSERLKILVAGYRRFALIAPLVLPPLLLASYLFVDSMPTWPGSGAHVLSIRGGEVGVHLCGITLFALLGFVRLPWISIVGLCLGMMVVLSLSRGGALAMLLPIALAVLLVPRMRQSRRILSVVGATLIVCSTFGLTIALPWAVSERAISVDQIVKNAGSIIYGGGDPALEGTKQWRVQWWDTIVGYTVNGRYFWTGKGFGINLADADGFQVVDEAKAPPLRSPHNSHLTMLARSGVPGLTLWILVAAAWGAMMLRLSLQSRARGDKVWARFFVFIFGYWLSIIIDASFDVALEGPMIGIWYWTLFGIGIGASVLYRFERRTLRRPRPATALGLHPTMPRQLGSFSQT